MALKSPLASLSTMWGVQEQFKTDMKDLTNFLAYMSDPIKEEREYIGKFVILYLLIFSILSYLLYREFKKDVH